MAAKNVLDELRSRFDYVIVDSSPLLAVTDAAILAANADGVLIMARFGQTKREHLMHAVGNLRDVGARPLGALLTLTPARGGSSYSYSYYGDGGLPSRNSEAVRSAEATGNGRSNRWPHGRHATRTTPGSQ